MFLFLACNIPLFFFFTFPSNINAFSALMCLFGQRKQTYINTNPTLHHYTFFKFWIPKKRFYKRCCCSTPISFHTENFRASRPHYKLFAWSIPLFKRACHLYLCVRKADNIGQLTLPWRSSQTRPVVLMKKISSLFVF